MAKKDYSSYSKEELIQIIHKLEKKRYGLVWEDKPEILAQECKTKLPIITEVKSKGIFFNKNAPTNILIEGDNYHALWVLNYTHKRKIDFIYIDPPYNTGNKTWKYNNQYVDDNDAFKHSKWLSFMFKRLSLSKNLLKEDGVICVTIDNYEVHNLRHIMQDIFSDKEIVITVIEHNYRGRAKNNFALTHEYAIWALPKGRETITRLREYSKDISRNLRRTGQGSRRHESPTMFYGIEVDKKTLKILSVTKPLKLDEPIPPHNNERTEIVYPIDKDGVERRWYYGSDRIMDEVKKGNIWAKIIDGRIEIHYYKPGKLKRRKSVWSGPRFDGSTYGSELLTEIIGENDFPFPKSIFAVKECIEAATNNKNAIILDFFAGSGTTAHAVAELNKEDGGNRKSISITNNENNICTEIFYPRIKNIMEGYRYTGNEKKLLFEEKLNLNKLKKIDVILSELELIKEENEHDYDELKKVFKNNTISLFGIKKLPGFKEGYKENLKYYKTDFVPFAYTDSDKRLLTNKSTEMLCLAEEIYDEIIFREGEFSLFENENKITAIIYDEDFIEPCKAEIKKYHKPTTIYVFSYDKEYNQEDFSDVEDKVKIKPIPEAILNVYRKIARR